jgi:hypothetical protein
MELTIGLRGMSGLWILGRLYKCGGLLWYGVSLWFSSKERLVLCLERSDWIFLSTLAVGFLDKGS